MVTPSRTAPGRALLCRPSDEVVFVSVGSLRHAVTKSLHSDHSTFSLQPPPLACACEKALAVLFVSKAQLVLPLIFLFVLSVAVVLGGWLAWSLVVAGPCSSYAPQRPRLYPASTSSHCRLEWFLVAARSRLVLTETTCPHHFSSLSSANAPLRL